MKEPNSHTDAMQLGISFAAIRVLRFAYTEPSKSVDPEQMTIGLQTNIEFGSLTEDGLFPLHYSVAISTEEHEQFADISVEFVFSIQGHEQFEKQEESLQVPKSFLTTLVSISHSTMRGILVSRGAGTILESLILPIINPAELIERMLPGRE